jgi:hypothetical protein
MRAQRVPDPDYAARLGQLVYDDAGGHFSREAASGTE